MRSSTLSRQPTAERCRIDASIRSHPIARARIPPTMEAAPHCPDSCWSLQCLSRRMCSHCCIGLHQVTPMRVGLDRPWAARHPRLPALGMLAADPGRAALFRGCAMTATGRVASRLCRIVREEDGHTALVCEYDAWPCQGLPRATGQSECFGVSRNSLVNRAPTQAGCIVRACREHAAGSTIGCRDILERRFLDKCSRE